MFCQGRLEREVADHVSADDYKISRNQVSSVEVTHSVSDRARGRPNDFEFLERGRRGVQTPFRGSNVRQILTHFFLNLQESPAFIPYILFNLFRVGPTVKEDVLDAGVGKKLQRVLDQRYIR